ncbi:MAG: 30S ribosomal protein S24e [Nanobdellota archaeon]
MEIEITKEKETPLLSRKRITAWAHHEKATPSRKEVLSQLAKKAKTKPELVIIKHIYTRFGETNMKIIAHVYKDRETLEKLERKNLIEKNKPAEKENSKEEKTEQEETKETAEENPENKEE